MKVFLTLAQVAATASKKEKEAILSKEGSAELKDFLWWTYNRYKTFRVQLIDMPDTFAKVQANIHEELCLLLGLMSEHRVTPTESRGMIKRVLAKCTEENAEWVCKIIRKDLKIGISESTINKSFPNLIPVFDVMLALPVQEPKSGITRWDSLKWPMECSPKEDGYRLIAVCDGAKVNLFTREGHEAEALDFLKPSILKLRPGTSYVLDGELVGAVYNPNCATAKKNKEKGKNWEFAQAISMGRSSAGSYPEKEMKQCLAYRIWDIIPLDYFMSQGSIGTCNPMRRRRTELAGLFERSGAIPNLELMSSTVVNNKEEAVAFFTAAVSKGLEGAMLKDLDALYEFRRSPFMLKMKQFHTCDLRIIGAIEGGADTKFAGSLGALVVSDDAGMTCEVGSGFDDEQRLELWFKFKRGELCGLICEVIFQERTADNSLRLPVFVRMRPDKTTVSLT